LIAEIVVERADPTQPNMALQTWKAGRVRKSDVIVAKNYLNADEIDHLNRIVTLFLEFAELRARQRKEMRMEDWRRYVNTFIEFNESPLLTGQGRISHERMVAIAHERYEQFDAARRGIEARAADEEDLAELEAIEKSARLSGKKGGSDGA
jgi:hypothetical protein